MAVALSPRSLFALLVVAALHFSTPQAQANPTPRLWRFPGISHISFHSANRFAIDLYGDEPSIVISERSTDSIWRLFSDGQRRRVAGSGRSYIVDSWDGELATEARLAHPCDIEVTKDNIVFLDDSGIRLVSRTTGVLTTVAGKKNAVRIVNADHLNPIDHRVRTGKRVYLHPSAFTTTKQGEILAFASLWNGEQDIHAAIWRLSYTRGEWQAEPIAGLWQDQIAPTPAPATSVSLDQLSPNGMAVTQTGDILVASNHNRWLENRPHNIPQIVKISPAGSHYVISELPLPDDIDDYGIIEAISTSPNGEVFFSLWRWPLHYSTVWAMKPPYLSAQRVIKINHGSAELPFVTVRALGNYCLSYSNSGLNLTSIHQDPAAFATQRESPSALFESTLHAFALGESWTVIDLVRKLDRISHLPFKGSAKFIGEIGPIVRPAHSLVSLVPREIQAELANFASYNDRFDWVDSLTASAALEELDRLARQQTYGNLAEVRKAHPSLEELKHCQLPNLADLLRHVHGFAELPAARNIRQTETFKRVEKLADLQVPPASLLSPDSVSHVPGFLGVAAVRQVAPNVYALYYQSDGQLYVTHKSPAEPNVVQKRIVEVDGKLHLVDPRADTEVHEYSSLAELIQQEYRDKGFHPSSSTVHH